MQTLKKLRNGQGVLLLASVILSVLIRIPGLSYTSYWWRAVQTEMTAYWFGVDGIDLINYQTPLFGPPWQIPLEFPLFQATAAMIVNSGLVENMVFACRLTALIYFYLSALFLYLICREIFSDGQTNLAILTIYLWLPYNIYYSLEPLIDYLALGLALGYLYFVLLWIKSGSSTSIWNTVLAVIFGSLAVVVKPTTAPIVAISIAVFVTKDIISRYKQGFHRPFNTQLLISKIWNQRMYWFSLGVMSVAPLLAGAFWTRYSDHIKNSSIFTQWLTSSALVAWNFGTWELRKNPLPWIVYSFTIQRFLLPYGLLFFGIVGVYIAAKQMIKYRNENDKINLFIVSIWAGSLLVFAVFLNLYRHEYYYISLSASMAVIAGYGIICFLRTSQKWWSILIAIFALWAAAFIIFSIKDYKKFQDVAIRDTQKMQDSAAWAQEVKQYVSAEDWVVFVQYDWDPTPVYSLERKVMVVSPRELELPLCQMLLDDRFSLVVVGDLKYSENAKLLEKTLTCFNTSVEVMPGVYQVQH